MVAHRWWCGITQSAWQTILFQLGRLHMMPSWQHSTVGMSTACLLSFLIHPFFEALRSQWVLEMWLRFRLVQPPRVLCILQEWITRCCVLGQTSPGLCDLYLTYHLRTVEKIIVENLALLSQGMNGLLSLRSADWVRQLWPAFQARAQEFRRGAGPEAFLRTWFLDDQHIHRWTRWRELRLVPQLDFWVQDLFQLWRDQIRDRDTLEFWIVDPPVPAIPGWESHLGDLIIRQNPSPARRSILVSTLIQEPVLDRRMLWAMSVPGTQPRHELLRQLGLMFHSWHHPCTIRRGHRLLMDGLLRHVQASGLMVTVDQRELDDATSLMQGTVHHTPHAGLIPEELTNLDLGDLPRPAWETLIHSLWLASEACDPFLGPFLDLNTWFLHHDTQRHGFECRTWRVTVPVGSWEAQLRKLWHPLMDPDEPFRLVLVQPAPRDSLAPHIIVLQGSTDYAGILLTAKYDMAGLPWTTQLAVSTFRQVSGDSLLQHAGAARPCDSVPCTLWRHPQQLDLSATHTCMDGDGFEILVPQDHTSSSPDFDGVSLLAAAATLRADNTPLLELPAVAREL